MNENLIKFIPLTASLKQIWDEIVHKSDDAWLFHLYDWLNLEEEVWDWQSLSFLVEHEGTMIGIVPLQMNKKTHVLKSDLMGDCGVALVNTLDPAFRERVLKCIYQHIESIGFKNQSPFIEIYISALANNVLQDRWQVNPLVKFHYEDISTQTLIVDLSRDEAEILSSSSKDARLNLRKAQDLGYRLRIADGIDTYYHVHCESYKRTGVTPHPRAYFQGIYDKICSKGHAVIWEALDPKGNAVAFDIIACFKEKAFYWTSCCLTTHLDTGVNYLLQFQAMSWAKSKGALWFETGESFPGALDGKKRGLTTFKEKFGGQLHRLFKGRLVLDYPSQQNLLFKSIAKLFKNKKGN